MNKKKLYESIMATIAKEVKKALNENYKVTDAKDLKNLYNKTLREYNLSEREFEDLMYVVNSDNHVNSYRLRKLIEELEMFNGFVPNMPLYRGCSDEELKIINETQNFPTCTVSFSESKEAASHFGKNIIEIRTDAPLFCYHKFLGDYYTSMKLIDPDIYEMEDGDDMIEAAETELEWICSNLHNIKPTDEPGVYILEKCFNIKRPIYKKD